MAWDANRPVPWKRLIREAAIFLVIGALAMLIFVKQPRVATFVGLFIGMLFYVGFVAVLSKFGYERQSIRQARAQREAVAAAASSAAVAGSKARPAPTKRTSTGPSQRPNRSTKKRRK